VEAVVHLAAHAHAGPVGRIFSRGRFQTVNASGTERLAQAGIRQGVRRFIYLSSVGVHGAESPAGSAGIHRFDESDTPAPHNDYARSKLEGENRLRAACRDSAMSFTLLRAPVVFGPGVGANFRALLRAIMIGLPLPLRGVRAQRSVIYVEHLAEIIRRCVEVPAARNALFLASDHDHEIESLVRSLAEAMQRPARLWRCPAALDRVLFCTPVLGGAWRSLTRPLLVNSTRVREALNWSPAIAPDEALRRTAAAYRGLS
jgi:UDP-glucose 4-epimerase